MHDACVVLFTKPAVPGRVKTRLLDDLAPGEAAALHAAFLADVLATLRSGRFALRVAWALEGPETLPLGDLRAFRQEGRDLGERLWHGLSLVAERFPRVVAVGSDHPELTLARVEEAIVALDEVDLALGPADDGGYYLLAARREALLPELFSGIHWSSSQVLAQTLERSAAAGLDHRLLPAGADVDTRVDLQRLVARLRAGSAPCPATRRLLASWGRLDAVGAAS